MKKNLILSTDAVFYDGSKLTPLGTLSLMGLGIGLVTLALSFFTKLFKH